MKVPNDRSDVLFVEEIDEVAALLGKPARPPVVGPPRVELPAAATVRLHGFDLDERPLIAGVPGLPGEVVPARTAVPLHLRQIGSTVVVVFEQADARHPIILGVLQDGRPASAGERQEPVAVQIDDERFLISAEREIELRCGEASITLTRAGKVLIKGKYVLSRSSGYNKIKGAAVDIN